MGLPTRRGFLQKTSIGLFASLGGCASIGNDEEIISGNLQIENEDDEQHQFQVTISELVPRTNTIADTPTGNPSPGIYQETHTKSNQEIICASRTLTNKMDLVTL